MAAVKGPSDASDKDPLRTSVDRGGPDSPIWPAGRVTRETLHRIPACITMHGRSPAKLPDVCRDPPAREVSLTAAKGVEGAVCCLSAMPRIACWILAVGRSAHPVNVSAIARSVRQSVRMKVAPRPLNLDPPAKTSPQDQG
jgi:hypothetical protein